MQRFEVPDHGTGMNNQYWYTSHTCLNPQIHSYFIIIRLHTCDTFTCKCTYIICTLIYVCSINFNYICVILYLESPQPVPFLIRRSNFNNLPVYLDYKNGRTRVFTVIKNIEGDIEVIDSIVKTNIVIIIGSVIGSNHYRPLFLVSVYIYIYISVLSDVHVNDIIKSVLLMSDYNIINSFYDTCRIFFSLKNQISEDRWIVISRCLKSVFISVHHDKFMGLKFKMEIGLVESAGVCILYNVHVYAI